MTFISQIYLNSDIRTRPICNLPGKLLSCKVVSINKMEKNKDYRSQWGDQDYDETRDQESSEALTERAWSGG